MAIEKDLHSVYIDNELPPAYIGKYEGLVESDSASAADQNKVKKLHALLQENTQHHHEQQKQYSQQFF